jgi:cyclophilin family peptidyl-prolyl cis-trans isomerase
MKRFEMINRFGWMTLMLVGVLSAATMVWAQDDPAATQPSATQPSETQPAETQPDGGDAPASQPDGSDGDEGQADAPDRSVLLDPSHESWSRQAPDVFKVEFKTTRGDFVVEVTREWAPLGADRFYNLVDNGFYDGCKFFRVINRFMAQFGINGDPEVSAVWREQRIKDDPNRQNNTRGRVTFAMAGPDTRTSQLFISFGDNRSLDSQGFAPFGQVVEGMDVVDHLYSDYGEGAPRGRGPDQGRIQQEGNPYLEAEFPYLDSIISAKVVE